ncbi:MAG: Uma2 family endonuclease [Planctomycetaceae bacterium]|nr:Uma2 family endonuclease [Planctomycetaceae bacterium]
MSTDIVTSQTTPVRDDTAVIPPLENGDRLTRAEFYRRWEAMPEVKHAERIEGVVYMAAAVRRESHGRPHYRIIGWLNAYEAETPGTEGGDNTTLQLDLHNDPQPDVYLLIDPACGGQCEFTDDDYIAHGPELIVEISASSASRDLHQKFDAYRRNGVKEYIVWKTLEEEIVWFRLQDGVYRKVEAGLDGVFKSEVFPGLWLDAPAMLRGDLKQVLTKLHEGIATEQHGTFVKHLESQLTTDN